jgi:hypothetical protein
MNTTRKKDRRGAERVAGGSSLRPSQNSHEKTEISHAELDTECNFGSIDPSLVEACCHYEYFRESATMRRTRVLPTCGDQIARSTLTFVLNKAGWIGAVVLVRFDHVADVIVNANHNIMRPATLRQRNVQATAPGLREDCDLAVATVVSSNAHPIVTANRPKIEITIDPVIGRIERQRSGYSRIRVCLTHECRLKTAKFFRSPTSSRARWITKSTS